MLNGKSQSQKAMYSIISLIGNARTGKAAETKVGQWFTKGSRKAGKREDY